MSEILTSRKGDCERKEVTLKQDHVPDCKGRVEFLLFVRSLNTSAVTFDVLIIPELVHLSMPF